MVEKQPAPWFWWGLAVTVMVLTGDAGGRVTAVAAGRTAEFGIDMLGGMLDWVDTAVAEPAPAGTKAPPGYEVRSFGIDWLPEPQGMPEVEETPVPGGCGDDTTCSSQLMTD